MVTEAEVIEGFSYFNQYLSQFIRIINNSLTLKGITHKDSTLINNLFRDMNSLRLIILSTKNPQSKKFSQQYIVMEKIVNLLKDYTFDGNNNELKTLLSKLKIISVNVINDLRDKT